MSKPPVTASDVKSGFVFQYGDAVYKAQSDAVRCRCPDQPRNKNMVCFLINKTTRIHLLKDEPLGKIVP